MTENPDALAEELALEAIERRDAQSDPEIAKLLDRAANWIAAALERFPELRP